MKTQKAAMVVAVLTLLAIPELAFAADPGVGAVQRFVSWLTGPLARGCAVLAVIGVFYGGLKGRIDRDHALYVISGIVGIFSAATFVDMAMS